MTLVLALLACKTRPPEVTWERTIDKSALAATDELSVKELEALVGNFARVHFATDSDVIEAAGQAALQANAEILARHPSVSVEIEGHADERGTVDYNLALGQRRAQQVVRLLAAHGVPRSRLSIVSLGEERPLVAGTGEVVWAENRRAEFRVLTGRAGGTVQ